MSAAYQKGGLYMRYCLSSKFKAIISRKYAWAIHSSIRWGVGELKLLAYIHAVSLALHTVIKVTL